MNNLLYFHHSTFWTCSLLKFWQATTACLPTADSSSCTYLTEDKFLQILTVCPVSNKLQINYFHLVHTVHIADYVLYLHYVNKSRLLYTTVPHLADKPVPAVLFVQRCRQSRGQKASHALVLRPEHKEHCYPDQKYVFQEINRPQFKYVLKGLSHQFESG